MGVKGNEPNFGQTVYSSFLLERFTDSSSGIRSRTKQSMVKNIQLTKKESRKLKKAVKVESHIADDEIGLLYFSTKARIEWISWK